MELKHYAILLALILSILAPNTALAQLDQLRNSTPQERADIQTDWMKKTLELDESAARAVADINLKYAKEMQESVAVGKPGMGAMLAVRKKSAAKDKELRSALTPEEYSVYEAKKSELRTVMSDELEKRQSDQSSGS